ncbi:hypothetical protein COU57_06010 [Candidatus Pacearchaeota archaeon CG10_big_fil_rev_8_21_14_0_10_32_14]|nr:MAG: hypothetical protein COU57_06010 [Candidatus Pacearchaeota archaeon CG10_big_fil_rev_8_21_14_0_10_32_14]
MRYEKYSKPILRISMALVFLYFGFSQMTSPDNWTGFVPQKIVDLTPFTATNIVMMNSVLELCLGLFLILGLYTRFSALILSLHLFGITTSLGFTHLGVRDFGLAFATLVVFLNGKDDYCMDNKFLSKKEVSIHIEVPDHDHNHEHK